MNRNFKVVFSKARGALMVVNEATSSIQAKGTKTVIAAAIAAVAGSAMAASAYVEAPTSCWLRTPTLQRRQAQQAATFWQSQMANISSPLTILCG